MSGNPNSSSENNNNNAAHSSGGGENGEGPPILRTATTTPSPPWSQIVRGDSDTPSPLNIDSDCVSFKNSCSTISPEAHAMENGGVGSCNFTPADNAGVKLAWNKPSNGSIVINPVMGAVSWPALSDSVKIGSKSPSDSSKSFADGSSLSSQGSVPSSSYSSPKKQSSSSNSSNSTPNQALSPRGKFGRRAGGGGGGPVVGNGPSQPLLPNSVGVVYTNPNPVNQLPNSNNWDHGPRVFPVQNPVDNHLQPATFRRGIGGFHPRVEGANSHGYGVRYEHDRVYNDWNQHRNYNGRDVHVQPQRFVAGAFFGPSHHYPYIHPFPFRAFGSPMGFEMASQMMYIPPESYRGVPFIAPIPAPVPVPVPVPVPLPLPVPLAVAVPTPAPAPTPIIASATAPAPLPVPVQQPPALPPSPDVELYNKVVKQISYYFSIDNLVKDTFLRQNMDQDGWVAIEVVSKFNLLQNMTEDIPFILEAVRNSNVVEVQGNKVRKHGDWKKWIMKSPSLSVLSPQPPPDTREPSSGDGDDQNRALESGDKFATGDPSCSAG